MGEEACMKGPTVNGVKLRVTTYSVCLDNWPSQGCFLYTNPNGNLEAVYSPCPHNRARSTDSHEGICVRSELSCPSGSQQVGGHNADISGCGLQGCSERYSTPSAE